MGDWTFWLRIELTGLVSFALAMFFDEFPEKEWGKAIIAGMGVGGLAAVIAGGIGLIWTV